MIGTRPQVRSVSEDFESMAREFRERIAEMTCEADRASDPTVKRAYLELAEEWRRLAQMAETRPAGGQIE